MQIRERAPGRKPEAYAVHWIARRYRLTPIRAAVVAELAGIGPAR